MYLVFITGFIIVLASNCFAINELKKRTIASTSFLSFTEAQKKPVSSNLIAKEQSIAKIKASTLVGYIFLLVSFLAIIKLLRKNKIKNTESIMTMEVQTILEVMPDALVICNQEGNITFINSMAKKIFGYTQSELVGKKIEILIPSHLAAQHEKHRQNYLNSPHIRPMGIELELKARHKNGREFPVEIELSPVETNNGVNTIAAIRDLTERKKICA